MGWRGGLAILGLLVAAGCAPTVTVRHLAVPGKLPVAEMGRLERIAVVVDGAGGVLPVRQGGDSSLVVRANAGTARMFGEAAAAVLASPWSRVVSISACDVSCTGLIGGVAPTAILRLSPSPADLAQVEYEVRERDEAGKEAQVRREYRVRGRFVMRYALLTAPHWQVLAMGEFPAELSEGFPRRQDLAEWLEARPNLRLGWTGELARDLLPTWIARSRRIHEGKGIPAGDWRSRWNSGVEAERAGRWSDARTEYLAAHAAAPRKDDKRILSGYLAEMDVLFTRPALGTAAGGATWWFDEPIAVLPLANATANLGAPGKLRLMVVEGLRRRGYRVVAPSVVDKALVARGMTQGGDQLRAVGVADLAQMTGARWWIGGSLEEYRTVNIGVYIRRHVRVRLFLQDQTGRIRWDGTGNGMREFVAAPSDAAGLFLGGLVGTMAEKATGTYLDEESEEAAASAVNPMPMAWR